MNLILFVYTLLHRGRPILMYHAYPTSPSSMFCTVCTPICRSRIENRAVSPCECYRQPIIALLWELYFLTYCIHPRPRDGARWDFPECTAVAGSFPGPARVTIGGVGRPYVSPSEITNGGGAESEMTTAYFYPTGVFVATSVSLQPHTQKCIHERLSTDICSIPAVSQFPI